MTQLVCLLSLLFSLSSPAMEGNADFRQSSFAAKTGQNLLNPGINVTERRMQHVLERHIVNGIPEFAGKSKFTTGVNLTELTRPLIGNFVKLEAAKEVKLLGTARDNLLNAAQNPRLRDAINNLYRKGAKVGSGSSMDAYRLEQATGQLLSKTGHGQKLLERRTQLQDILRDPSLTTSDRQIVKEVLIDIQKALSGQ